MIKKDIETRYDVTIMVHEFYKQVKNDSLLGGVFIGAIGKNWDAHLEKMVNFWDSLLFHEPVYSGQPYPKHADLPISHEHFERWLHLFYKTIDANFTGVKADEAKSKAANVAKVFMAKLFSFNVHPEASSLI